MTSFLFLFIALMVIGSPAFATPAPAPELDATTLTAIVSGITGLVVAYRMAQRRNSR
jgi:hypothetical protein